MEEQTTKSGTRTLTRAGMRETLSAPDNIGKEVLSALQTPDTYHPINNLFFTAGFLWGLPVPLLAILLTVSLQYTDLSGVTFTEVLITALNTPLLYLFYTCPFLSAISFGVFGTIRKQHQKQINRSMDRLRNLAIQDPLTELFNQRYIWIRLNEEIEEAKRQNHSVSVLMCDLDGFKQVNDRFGHEKGDRFLKEASRILKNTARSYDVVARYGGDEFFVLLPETSGESARHLADRLENEFRQQQPILEDNPDLVVGISIGIASYPEDALRPKTLVRIADRRMYEVKEKQSEPVDGRRR